MPQEQTQVVEQTAEEKAFADLQAQYDHSELENAPEYWGEGEAPEEEADGEEEAASEETPEAEAEEESPAQPPQRSASDERAALAERRIWELEQQINQLRQPRQEKPPEKDPLDELGEDLDPRLSGFLRSQREQINTLRNENQQLRQNIQQKDSDAFVRDFEGWLNESENEEFFGRGGLADITDEQRANRNETLVMMEGILGAYAGRGRKLSYREAFNLATRGVSASPNGKPAKPASRPAKGKAPAKIEEPEVDPEDDADEPELIERRKAYAGAAVQKPTQRTRSEAPGREKAVKTAARMMREQGFLSEE